MAARRAFTLMETLVYCGLAVLVLVAILTIFAHVRQTGYAASSSYVLGQDTAAGFARLRRDFTDTSLQSLRIESKPGQGRVSMCAARDNSGELQLTPQGVPAWNHYVAYMLEPDANGDGISRLIRFSQPHDFPGGLPLPSAGALTPGANADVVLNQVLAPNYRWGESSPGMRAPVAAADAPEGGFVVRFRRSDGSLSELNPNQADDVSQPGWSRNSTGSVLISLIMVERGSSGQYSSISLPITITPRH